MEERQSLPPEGIHSNSNSNNSSNSSNINEGSIANLSKDEQIVEVEAQLKSKDQEIVKWKWRLFRKTHAEHEEEIQALYSRRRHPLDPDELQRREDQKVTNFNEFLGHHVGPYVGIVIRDREGLDIDNTRITLHVVHKDDAEIFFELSDFVQRAVTERRRGRRRMRLQPKIGHINIFGKRYGCQCGSRGVYGNCIRCDYRIAELCIFLPNADVQVPARISELPQLEYLSIECPISVTSSRFFLDLVPQMPTLKKFEVGCWIVDDRFDLNVENRTDDQLEEDYDAAASQHDFFEHHWQNPHLRGTLHNLWSFVLHKCPNLRSIEVENFREYPTVGYTTIVGESLIELLKESTTQQLVYLTELTMSPLRPAFVEKLILDVIAKRKQLPLLDDLRLNMYRWHDDIYQEFVVPHLGLKSFQRIAATLRQHWNLSVGIERSPTAASIIENGPAMHVPSISLLVDHRIADTPQEREALITFLHFFGVRDFEWTGLCRGLAGVGSDRVDREFVFYELVRLCSRLNKLSVAISKNCAKMKKNHSKGMNFFIPSAPYVSLLEKFTDVGDESMLYGVLRGTIGTVFGNTTTATDQESSEIDSSDECVETKDCIIRSQTSFCGSNHEDELMNSPSLQDAVLKQPTIKNMTTDSDSSWASGGGAASLAFTTEATPASMGPTKKVPVDLKGPANKNMTATAENNK